LADFDAAIRLDPNNAAYHKGRGYSLHWLDRVVEARDALEESKRLGGDGLGLYFDLAAVYRDLGRADEATHYVALTRERLAEDDIYGLACLEAIAGNDDLALELLAQALEEGDEDRDWIRRDPDWRTLRDDPRFLRLLGDDPPP
jgi:tetratricopeptide (TPR) repeat protein